MKKKIINIFYVIFLFICFISNVDAETTKPSESDKTCSYAAKAYLNKLAGSVTASYDFKYKNNKVESFDITVYNITEDLYVNVTTSSDSKNYKSESFGISYAKSKDNKYTFNVKNVDDIVEYKFVIKTTKYGCTHDIKTFTLVKPRKNKFFEMDICKYEEVLDYYYCQEWITSNFYGSDEDIKEKINRERESQKAKNPTKCIECEIEKENQKTKERFEQIKRYIIIGLVLGIITDLIVIVVLINNIRRSTL